MILLRKALIPLAGVAVITLVIAVLGPPTVHAVVATLVKDVDNPARQPFAQECSTAVFDTFGRGFCITGNVPAGKRFVIETVSGQLVLTPGLKPISINLEVCAADKGTANYLPAALQGSSTVVSGDYFAVNQRVRLYADNLGACFASGFPIINIALSNGPGGGTAFADFTLSGYLVDLP